MKNTIKILNENNILYDIIDNKIYLENDILDLNLKNIKGVLDVSMIVNLKTLRCFKNKITEIKCNENLESLICDRNDLTKIDYNENLKNLNCSYNLLTEFECKNHLEILECEGNKIEKIICNNNLKFLNCSDNIIQKIENYKSLETLCCTENNLGILNVDKEFNDKCKIGHEILNIDNKYYYYQLCVDKNINYFVHKTEIFLKIYFHINFFKNNINENCILYQNRIFETKNNLIENLKKKYC